MAGPEERPGGPGSERAPAGASAVVDAGPDGPASDGATSGSALSPPDRDPVPPAALPRRHDVDWLRTLALVLLIAYHAAITFRPWAAWIGFPTSAEPLDALDAPMAALNVWRIPLLFWVSGMGVRFALERRGVGALILDRSLRILLPWAFGLFGLGIALAVLLGAVGWDRPWWPHFGHLWFLLNIYLYAVGLVGLLVHLRKRPDHALLRGLRRLLGWRAGPYLLALPLALEAALVDPVYFSLYVDTLHGWLLGLVCFLTGFLCACVREAFFPAALRLRWPSLVLATGLFLLRYLAFEREAELDPLTALECTAWVLAAFGFAARHLDRPSPALALLSPAAYPVYVLHLPVQFLLSAWVLERTWPPAVQLTVLTAGTLALCFAAYRLVLRRLGPLGVLFGVGPSPRT